MTEELKELLTKAYTNISNEEITQCTQTLMEIYANPEFLLQFMEIFMNPQNNPSLRQSAIISFGKNVKKCWASIIDTEIANQVKANVLEYFSNETDRLLLFNCVHAIEAIFSKDQWPEIFDFLAQLREQHGDPIKFDLCLYLSQYLIIKLQPETLEANQQFFVEVAKEGLTSDNSETVVYSCGLASVLIYCTNNEENEGIAELFILMMQAFHNAITDLALLSRIAARISFSFEADDFHVPANDLIPQMLELVQTDGLDKQVYVVICMLIEDLVKKCGKQITRELLEQILSVCLRATSAVFIEDASLGLQEDFLYIPGAIEECCRSIRNRRFFDILYEMINAATEDASDVATGSYAFYRCIEYMSEGIMKNIESVTEFLIQRLSYPNECVQEVTAMSMYEIGKLLQEGQDDIGNLMIEAIIARISEFSEDDSVEVLSHCLDALAKLLETSNIKLEFIEPLLEKLVQFIEDELLTSQVYNVLSNVVFSAGNDIEPFSQSLFPIIVEGAQIDEDENPILKQNALEALGQLIRFAGGEEASDCIELFIESYATDDLEIRSSVIVAIENLILVHVDLTPYKDQIIEIVNMALQLYEETSPQNEEEEEEMDDIEEDKVEKYEGEIRYIGDAVLMIKHIFKYAEPLIPDDPSPWAEECLKMMDCGNEDIQASATLASIYIWLYLIKNGVAPDDIYAATIKNFDSGGPNVVAAAFKLFTHFFERDIIPEKEVFDAVVENANRHTNTDYGDEMSQDDLELSANLYKFWAIIATKFPNDFPVTQFLDHGNRILKNGGNFEKSQYIGVLRQLYFSGLEFQGLIKKVILKMFFDNIDICDFSVIPEPILAIKKLIETDPEPVMNNIEAIVEQITEMMDAEYDGEVHFYTTITDCMSLLCTLMNTFPDSFDFDELLPRIINGLPVRGDEMEAQHIYGSLLSAVQSNEQVQAYAQDLFVAFAKTLGLTNKQIDAYKLSPETYAALVQFVKQTLAQDGAEQIISENLSEEAQKQLSEKLT